MSQREEVIDILMRRDGITRKDAIYQIEDCKQVMLDEGTDDAIENMLGIEPDYIFGVLGW